jgi:hypothetical protein
MLRRYVGTLLILTVMMAAVCPPAEAYSVLSHEELIDMVWDDSIAPLLHAKFPQATAEEIKAAEAYAYGGCVIQDLGYYPYGSKYFSDLMHYVESGDFVMALLRDARDVNEYAFALGALAHYVSDVAGHPAVNRAVAIEYPSLRRKYGDVVTYDQDPHAHIETEFGFDVVQVAKQRYAPKQYHDYIGFQVAQELLERAFRETYGLEVRDVMPREDQVLSSYRHAVSQTIPHITEVALATREQQLMKENKDFSRQRFIYNLSRADYEKEWGNYYRRPSFGARVLAFFIRLIPKIGPFRAAKYTDPTPETETMYFKSMNETLEQFRGRLAELRKSGSVTLPDMDCDTGANTRPGEYDRADRTYDQLLRTLDEHQFEAVEAPLRADLEHYYEHRTPPDKQTRAALGRFLQKQAPKAQAGRSTTP